MLHIPTDLTQVCGVSKLLFGNQVRLLIAAYVAEHDSGRVTVREIARELKLGDSVVAPVVKGFAAAQVLTPEPKTSREQTYVRLPHSFWELVRVVFRDVGSMSEPSGRP